MKYHTLTPQGENFFRFQAASLEFVLEPSHFENEAPYDKVMPEPHSA